MVNFRSTKLRNVAELVTGIANWQLLANWTPTLWTKLRRYEDVRAPPGAGRPCSARQPIPDRETGPARSWFLSFINILGVLAQGRGVDPLDPLRSVATRCFRRRTTFHSTERGMTQFSGMSRSPRCWPTLVSPLILEEALVSHAGVCEWTSCFPCTTACSTHRRQYVQRASGSAPSCSRPSAPSAAPVAPQPVRGGPLALQLARRRAPRFAQMAMMSAASYGSTSQKPRRQRRRQLRRPWLQRQQRRQRRSQPCRLLPPKAMKTAAEANRSASRWPWVGFARVRTAHGPSRSSKAPRLGAVPQRCSLAGWGRQSETARSWSTAEVLSQL